MKIIKEFYRLVNLLEDILSEIKRHRESFEEYKYNLNQVYRRN